MQKLLFPLGLAVVLHIPAFAQIPQSKPAGQAPAVSISFDEPTGPLTLSAALGLALRANADLTIARREVEATAGAIRQAGIIPNPSIAASIEDTRQATRTTTVQLNQPIELGGKRLARLSLAERSRDIAAIDLIGKESEVRSNVITAYYEVLSAQERHRLAQASVDLAKRATSAASRRVLAGKVSPVEENRARVAQSGVQIELAQAASELNATRRRLAATWGSSTPRFERVDERIDLLPPLPDLTELAKRLQSAPTLMRARSEVDRRQAMTQVERARQIPDITVSLGAKREEQLGRNQVIVGVSVPLPLFDRNQGNLQEALSRADKARDELAATQVRATSELGQAHARLNAALQEAQLLQREILPGAESVYEATTKGFELGKFNFLDVLDAQRTYFQAKSQYLRALTETHRAAAELDRIVGTPWATAPQIRSHQE